jgi:hypothetical protein
MTRSRSSYSKTIILLAVAALALMLATILSPPYLAWLFGIMAALTVATIWGGLICLRRDKASGSGTGEKAFPPENPRCLIRLHVGRELCRGDEVEVLSAAEIMATLDENASLDCLPFMTEMLSYCGCRLKVYRCIDKINDTAHKTGLRRMKGVVSLEGVRCNGGGHGGCQAGCQILWKTAWLKKAGRDSSKTELPGKSLKEKASSLLDAASKIDGKRYRCQFTELWNATSKMSGWDIRQDWRDLVSGNVPLGQWLTNIAIRLFNLVQRLRGGVGYPYLEPEKVKATPAHPIGLSVGDLVEVRSREEIQRTLDNNSKNRGLWFDREMLSHCGRRYKVLGIVDRIIDERTGVMLKMASPCVVLDGAYATGEWLRFNPQNEYIYWHEIWLRPIDAQTAQNKAV